MSSLAEDVLVDENERLRIELATARACATIDDAIAELATLRARVALLEGALADEKMEHGLLKDLLSRPQIDDFYEGIVLEAAHQRQRWGDAHDRSKSAENWFWLVGYLSGKALRSAIEGDQAKARHHTISSAAALFQWWKAIKDSVDGTGQDTDLDPDATRAALEKPHDPL